MPRWLVVRHEEALPADAEGDALRALSPSGRARMHAQARALLDALPSLDLVLTSPLVRAVQTAEILVSAFDLATPVRAHRAVVEPPSLDALGALVEGQPVPRQGTVAIVGHEPTLSAWVGHLTGVGDGAPPLATGQAVLLERSGSRWSVLGAWRGGAPTPSDRRG